MKIYFAGSIRGGRDDAALYQEIIQFLREYGEVLTEHLGDPLLSAMGEGKEAEAIFDRDVEWLTSADVIVAEVTQPSLGVGYEIGLSEMQGKRILCLYRPQTERRVSAMLLGNPKITMFEYVSVDMLHYFFKEYFA